MTATIDGARIERRRSLKPFTTLRAGGQAESFIIVRSAEDLATVAESAQAENWHTTVLGWGSNVLPSDAGVDGLVVINRATRIEFHDEGEVVADSGCGFQELFLKAAQANLTGLEFAVGIPGTLGGALVSNAGAYRSNIADHITGIDVVFEGKRQWMPPDIMEFSYRDSILRRLHPPQCTLVRVKLKLPKGDPKRIYDEAREYQRQRVSKQPAPASAGSFFKNVYDQSLADSLPDLPEKMKEAAIVPAGFLIERVGLRGTRHGGAMVGRRHANFLLNVAGATAVEIRQLAGLVARRVREKYGVTLEEEVLYLGDWSAYQEVWQD